MTKQKSADLADKFDHTSEDMMRDPWDMLSIIRSECPVAHSSQHGGFYIATTHDTVMEIESNWETYSSAKGVGIPPQPYQVPPVELDPPRHSEFRRILNKLFTRKTVEKKRKDIENTVHGLINNFIGRGSADLVAELIHPLMPQIALPIIGIPMADEDRVLAWVHYILFNKAKDPAGVQQAGMELAGYLMGLSASRRGGPKDEDSVLGLLLDATIEGEPVSDDEIARTLTLTLFGGLDTSAAVMSEAILFLSRNPQERRKLRDGDYNWGVAVEEFVRISSPLVGLRRTLTKDTKLGGVDLKKGDWVFAMFLSANRDENRFPNADQCLLDRTDNPHVGFGADHHLCLGRNLARIEIEILLKIVLDRLYDIRVPDNFSPEYWAGEPRGMKSLPATFTPGPIRSTAD
jgi:cytochrome P450